jgi:hypothetical protein
VGETPDRDSPYAYHDDQERAEVGEILKPLPLDHPARVAYQFGLGPLALTHFTKDEELASNLKLAFRNGQVRVLQRTRDEALYRPGHVDALIERRGATSFSLPGGRRRTDPKLPRA